MHRSPSAAGNQSQARRHRQGAAGDQVGALFEHLTYSWTRRNLENPANSNDKSIPPEYRNVARSAHLGAPIRGAAQASHPSPVFGSQRTTNLAKLAKSLDNTGDPLPAIVHSAAVLIVVALLAAVLERAQLLDTNMLTQESVSLDDYID